MTTEAKDLITSYITDMLALEHHLQKAIAGQLGALDEHSAFAHDLRDVHDTCANHVNSLNQLADRRASKGQGLAGSVKNAASSMLGVGAAFVDMLRTEKLPKNLRDDYTAISLANAGYMMLYTTARSVEDVEVAELAHQHLANHSLSIGSITHMIPSAVIHFLKDEGFSARDDLLPDIETEISTLCALAPR